MGCSNIPTTESEIKYIIKTLKTKNSTGYDGISSRILKNCMDVISKPLSCNTCHWGGRLLDVVPNLTLSLRRGCAGRVAKQALTGFDPDISTSYHQTVF
jgi:hypothetical protein